jgi:hypothetical protein
MIETIHDAGAVVAIIIYDDHRLDEDQIEFITPNDFTLQLGYMNRPAGYQVIPHIHHPVRRETIGTQEVLIVKRGVIEIDFYSFAQVYLESRRLSAGDVIMLAGAGHAITVVETATIVEVKNGPFVPGADKGRFEGIKR